MNVAGSGLNKLLNKLLVQAKSLSKASEPVASLLKAQAFGGIFSAHFLAHANFSANEGVHFQTYITPHTLLASELFTVSDWNILSR